MPTQAYTNIRVIDDIYVSSSSDYYATVFYTYHGKRIKRDYDISGGELLAKTEFYGIQIPRYMQHEIACGVLNALTSFTTKYHEYDRDHNRRYTDHRYHCQELVDWLITLLTHRVEATAK